jgi:flagellin-like protein
MGYISKGVSPVVASVLLIAFSIAIATLVGTWAMNYTQNKLTTLESDNKCLGVSIQQLEFKYDNSSQEGIIRLQNSGDPIKGYRIYAFNGNNQELLKEFATGINKAEIKTFSFETNLSDVREIMVEVVDCPTVKLRLTI